MQEDLININHSLFKLLFVDYNILPQTSQYLNKRKVCKHKFSILYIGKLILLSFTDNKI